MRKKLNYLILLLIVGCVPSQERLTLVAREQASRMMPPRETLSGFDAYKLEAMARSPAVDADRLKRPVAAKLERILRSELLPLLECWGDNRDGTGRTLMIKPTLVRLYIVSGGARFMVGGMAGDSFIDIDLKLYEEGTDNIVAMTRVTMSSSGASGSWSVGVTDQNLLVYAAAAVKQYLIDHYAAPGGEQGSGMAADACREHKTFVSSQKKARPRENSPGNFQDSAESKQQEDIEKRDLDDARITYIRKEYHECMDRSSGYSINDCVDSAVSSVISAVPEDIASRFKPIKNTNCMISDMDMSERLFCIDDKVAKFEEQIGRIN